jgi:hypothetical protein
MCLEEEADLIRDVTVRLGVIMDKTHVGEYLGAKYGGNHLGFKEALGATLSCCSIASHTFD